MFSGYFSQFVSDMLPQQNVLFLERIMESPTKNRTVVETMKKRINVAEKCNQKYAIVTYDLTIALKAQQIQATESPTFDRLFIMFGDFHLELAFYGAQEAYLDERGVENVLVESEVLAEGSLSGLIEGKSYNCCVRIHDLLATAMEEILYGHFVDTCDPSDVEALREILKDLPDNVDALMETLNENSILKKHSVLYNECLSKLLDGDLGPTAKFWATYSYLVNRVHRGLLWAV